MSFPIRELVAAEFPAYLQEIPQPPTALNVRGQLPPSHLKLLSVVGSRKYTSYGKQVVDHLISGLASQPIGIVSGLALGIDSLAHEAALRYGLYTLAIPGGGLDDTAIYPPAHKKLACRILEAGGGLLSEFAPTFRATKWSFPQRNRLVAGISHATLLIEAAELSGTLITARLATDYNRELLVVPGNIFSRNSKGVHQFLKLGATPVTDASDILTVLGIDVEKAPPKPVALAALSPAEQTILAALHEPCDIDSLIRATRLPAHEVNILLMQMELKGLLVSEQNKYRIK